MGSISRPTHWVKSVVRQPPADAFQARYNGFQGSASGTGSCTLTIPCPKSSTRAPVVVITDIVASGTGGTLTITSSASGMDALTVSLPIDHRFDTPIMGPEGEDVTLAITGVTGAAALLVTGQGLHTP